MPTFHLSDNNDEYSNIKVSEISGFNGLKKANSIFIDYSGLKTLSCFQ